jgi:glycosyltransferase involved in cell wall biosynthesis
MIVKNEEKNIEKALGWAKPVAYEQIVVDTGSTDNTVKLAEKMGAKVFDFEWINDFAAAKNYAIEQATGNWIAFLDADEYFTTEDAAKLIKELEHIEGKKKSHIKTTILNMPWVHLNDNNEVTGIGEQTRVFRNIKEIRYVGKIHEQISVYGDIKRIDDISIIHTGYAETEYREKGKAERNIKMLRAELEGRPDDLTLKAYLADSLSSRILLDENPDADDLAEVDAIFSEVIERGEEVPGILINKAYTHLLSRIWNDTERSVEYKQLCERAYSEYPENIEFVYHYSVTLNKAGKYAEARDILKKMEDSATDSSRNKTSITVKTKESSIAIIGQQLLAAQGLGDVDGIIEYAAVLLSLDKSQQNILAPYIHTLLKNGVTYDEVLGMLGNIYDIGNPNDLLIIARAAKACGATEFAGLVITVAKEIM